VHILIRFQCFNIVRLFALVRVMFVVRFSILSKLLRSFVRFNSKSIQFLHVLQLCSCDTFFIFRMIQTFIVLGCSVPALMCEWKSLSYDHLCKTGNRYLHVTEATLTGIICACISVFLHR